MIVLGAYCCARWSRIENGVLVIRVPPWTLRVLGRRRLLCLAAHMRRALRHAFIVRWAHSSAIWRAGL